MSNQFISQSKTYSPMGNRPHTLPLSSIIIINAKEMSHQPGKSFGFRVKCPNFPKVEDLVFRHFQLLKIQKEKGNTWPCDLQSQTSSTPIEDAWKEEFLQVIKMSSLFHYFLQRMWRNFSPLFIPSFMIQLQTCNKQPEQRGKPRGLWYFWSNIVCFLKWLMDLSDNNLYIDATTVPSFRKYHFWNLKIFWSHLYHEKTTALTAL